MIIIIILLIIIIMIIITKVEPWLSQVTHKLYENEHATAFWDVPCIIR